MKASATVVLQKPVQEVWAFVSDLKNMEKWVVGVSDVQIPSKEPVKAGTEFASRYTYGRKTHQVTYEVTEFSPPYHMSMKSTSGPFPFEGTIELEEVDGSTKLVNTIDAGSDGTGTTIIFALFGPLLRIMMSRQLKKELLALKSSLEK